MVEYRLNEDGILVEVDSNLGMMEEIEAEQATETFNAPVERGFWTKFKNFMFKEINLKEFLFQEVDLSLKLRYKAYIYIFKLTLKNIIII